MKPLTCNITTLVCKSSGLGGRNSQMHTVAGRLNEVSFIPNEIIHRKYSQTKRGNEQNSNSHPDSLWTNYNIYYIWLALLVRIPRSTTHPSISYTYMYTTLLFTFWVYFADPDLHPLQVSRRRGPASGVASQLSSIFIGFDSQGRDSIVFCFSSSSSSSSSSWVYACVWVQLLYISLLVTGTCLYTFTHTHVDANPCYSKRNKKIQTNAMGLHHRQHILLNHGWAISLDIYARIGFVASPLAHQLQKQWMPKYRDPCGSGGERFRGRVCIVIDRALVYGALNAFAVETLDRSLVAVGTWSESGWQKYEGWNDGVHFKM